MPLNRYEAYDYDRRRLALSLPAGLIRVASFSRDAHFIFSSVFVGKKVLLFLDEKNEHMRKWRLSSSDWG